MKILRSFSESVCSEYCLEDLWKIVIKTYVLLYVGCITSSESDTNIIIELAHYLPLIMNSLTLSDVNCIDS